MTRWYMLTPRKGAAILAVCAAVMAAMFGYEIGGGWPKGWVLGVVFALGAYFALVLLDKGMEHFRTAQYTLGVMAVCAWGFIVALEIVGHVGFNATARLDGMQSATLQQTSYEDSRATVANIEAQVAALTDEARWDSRPLPAIVADIEKAKLSPRWSATAECTDVTAKRSRDFCAAYAALTAEKAIAEGAVTARAELEIAQKALVAARAASGAQANDTHVNGAHAQGLVLASAFTLTQDPGSGSVYWANMAFSLATAIFMVLSGIIWAVFPSASGAGGHAIAHPAEHPDLEAAQKAAAASLNAMAVKMRAAAPEPAYEARRLTGAIATAGGIMPVLGGIRMHEVKAA